MLQISYRLTLACPVFAILSQYYGYDHIGTVHPQTLGGIRLVEVREEDREVIYDHLWPTRPGRHQLVSRVRHRYFPPLTMEFDFPSGRYRGTRVRAMLRRKAKIRLWLMKPISSPVFPTGAGWRVSSNLS